MPCNVVGKYTRQISLTLWQLQMEICKEGWDRQSKLLSVKFDRIVIPILARHDHNNHNDIDHFIGGDGSLSD